MAPGGFYLLHRGWQDNPVFRGEEFSRRDAFVWLIEEAAFRERRVAMPKGEITLQRGQLSHSFRFMAKAWKWEEPRVRRFITSLSNAQIIDASTVAGQTVITLCNYTTYQNGEDQPDAPTDAATTQDRRTTDANKKEGNKGKKLDVAKATSPRASRIPDDFRPRPLDRSTVAGEVAERRGQAWMRRVFEEFTNYWRSASGRTATKLDWQATWANRVIEADQRETGNGRSQKHTGLGPTVE